MSRGDVVIVAAMRTTGSNMGGSLAGISVCKLGDAAVVMMSAGKAGEPGLEPLARDGLATLCIGGGQGVAMALELVD